MDRIDAMISEDQLDILRQGYLKEDMIQLLAAGMPALDARTTQYINSIRGSFYDGGGTTIGPKDRERCLIAVLASRDAGLNLALHIYLGLMEGLTPQEIADVIFLSGVYAGVDRISDGLAAELKTLRVLVNVIVETARPPLQCTASQVVNALVAAFAPPLPPPLTSSQK
jgi:alkylhydroperoxidase/carboxymuconolactone decarboxylase family protein YurZ